MYMLRIILNLSLTTIHVNRNEVYSKVNKCLSIIWNSTLLICINLSNDKLAVCCLFLGLVLKKSVTVFIVKPPNMYMIRTQHLPNYRRWQYNLTIGPRLILCALTMCTFGPKLIA